MGKSQNIVHNYYKKEIDSVKILVQVNPKSYEGQELTVLENGHVSLRELQYDENIAEDLESDGFQPASPLEFHLYLSGLA